MKIMDLYKIYIKRAIGFVDEDVDDDYKIKPYCIILPRTSAYVKSYDDEAKWMHSLIEDNETLDRYKYITMFEIKSRIVSKK